MSRELQAFKDALLVRNVVTRAHGVQADEHDAMEFPTEDALKKYLEEHPRAKAPNHTVRKRHDDAAAPAVKEDVERAVQLSKRLVPVMERLIHEKDGAQLIHFLGDYKTHVEKAVEGVNSIPPGKERERAKAIVKAIHPAFENINKENGYRWQGKRYVPPGSAEKAIKVVKPLIEELESLLSGQRMLSASERPFPIPRCQRMSRELQAFKDALLVRHVVARVASSAEHEAMEFPTDEALKKYLDAHPGADKGKHRVKKDDQNASNSSGLPETLTGFASSHAQKARVRSETVTSTHDVLKALQDKAEDADHPSQKKFDTAYKKLFESGEASAKSGTDLLKKVQQYENHIPDDSQAGHAYKLLDDAIKAWDRNRIDHLRVPKGFGYRIRGMQAEQTWAYAKTVDDHIQMLDRALKGEFD